MPGRNDISDKSKDIEEQFLAAAEQNFLVIQSLAQQLARERDESFDEIWRPVLKAGQEENEDKLIFLNHRARRQIEQSDYVRYGVGSAIAIVAAVQETMRRERLQLAMFDAVPELLSSRLS